MRVLEATARLAWLCINPLSIEQYLRRVTVAPDEPSLEYKSGTVLSLLEEFTFEFSARIRYSG